MPPAIPASQLVNVIPGVLSAGGNPLSLNAIFLTADTSIPIGVVQAFASLDEVEEFFGASSREAEMAAIYFAGFTGPGPVSAPETLYFAQYNEAAVAAYLRSGSFEGVTLAELQALSGVLTLTIDGSAETTGNIDLSGATSFSNAASLIQTALQAQLASTTCVYDSQLNAFVITSPTTGDTSTITFATGTLSAGLKVTSATGAVLSQGADAAVAAEVMNGITEATQNWATFTTTFEPNTAGKLAFAEWVQTTNERFAYVGWDSDTGPAAGVDADSFGAQVVAAQMDGIFPVYDLSAGDKGAFVCGCVASIDFDATGGRITFAYKHQAGLTADVTDATTAANLRSNGYNYYAAFATANDNFVNLQPGSTPGAWSWFDAYINQIWLNNALQLAYMNFLSQVNSVPYNQQGYNQLRAVAFEPINAALNAGVIQPGVTLSQSQKQQINTAVGGPAAQVVSTVGWYLDIKDASPTTRAQRESPPMTLYYADGGSIQKIELSSIAVE
jgi:hypothetical protein